MSDDTELERIYDEHADGLFAFLLNFLRNEQDARDLLQEVFVRIARQPGLLRRSRDERTYLLGLAHNAAVDWMRRRAAREKYHERSAGLAAVFAASDNPDEEKFREALSQALAKLPEEQRAVVHLKLWEDLTFEQIAETLAISPNTAASRYRYGLDKLRDHLRPLYEEIHESRRI